MVEPFGFYVAEYLKRFDVYPNKEDYGLATPNTDDLIEFSDFGTSNLKVLFYWFDSKPPENNDYLGG